MGSQRHLLDTADPPSTPTANQTGESELNRANFDSNMVIILAALLCALICALGLNSMVRCVLRCTHRIGSGQGATPSHTGLKKKALRKIPILVHGSGQDGSDPGMNNNNNNNNDDYNLEVECPICLGEFVDGEKVRVLPKCNHRFHVRCIDTWLGSHSSCPNCRHSLVDAVSSSRKAAPSPPSREGGGRVEHVVVELNINNNGGSN